MTRRQWVWFAALSAAVFGVATLLDPLALRVVLRITEPPVSFEVLGVLRSAGHWLTWVIVAAAFLLVDRSRAPGGPLKVLDRGLSLFLAVSASALAAEVMKLLIRRERPAVHGGEYGYRPWDVGTFDTGGLVLPSSHASVAFGAAWMLCVLHPGAWPVWLAIAAGCAATRLLYGAHFLSDVVAGAIVGFAVTALVQRVRRRLRWTWAGNGYDDPSR